MCGSLQHIGSSGLHQCNLIREDNMPVVQMRAGALNEVRKIIKARSDEELAGRLGVSRETLRLIEGGKRCPSSTFMAGVVAATRKDFSRWFKVSS